jgi:alpha/beta superfamily hydrolase
VDQIEDSEVEEAASTIRAQYRPFQERLGQFDQWMGEIIDANCASSTRKLGRHDPGSEQQQLRPNERFSRPRSSQI